MAFAKASNTQLAPRRSGAVVSKSKFVALQERSAAATKRIKQAADEDGDALLSVGAGVALALYEKPDANGKKRTLPTVMGIDPAVLWGGVGYAFTRKSKGKTARMARQACIALATVGANRSTTRGSVKVSGTEIGADEDDGDGDDEDSDL